MTLIATLAVTKSLAEVEIRTLSNIFFNVKGEALVETLSAYLAKVDIKKITKKMA